MRRKILQVGVSNEVAATLAAHARRYDMPLAAFLRIHLTELANELGHVRTETTKTQLELYETQDVPQS